MDLCDVWIISAGCNAAGNIAQDAATNVLGAIAAGVASWAIGLLTVVWELITETTTPQTNGKFLYEWAGRTFGIALVVSVGFMALQVMTALLRGRGVSEVKRAPIMAGVAVLATTVSLPVVHLLTQAVDGIADGLTTAVFGDMTSMGNTLVAWFDDWFADENGETSAWGNAVGETLGMAGAAIALIAFGLLTVTGTLAVWAALLIRSMLLYVFVVTAPIAIMGLIWEPTRSWFRKWAAGVCALIFTKLGVIVVFGLGVSMLGTLNFGQDMAGAFGQLFSGILLLCMASIVPVAAFKFFSFLGEESVAGHHGDAHAGASAAQGVVKRANPTDLIQRGGSRDSGGTEKSANDGGSAKASKPQPAEATTGGRNDGGGDSGSAGKAAGKGPPGGGGGTSGTASRSAGSGSGAGAGGGAAAGGTAAGGAAAGGAVAGSAAAVVAAGKAGAEKGEQAGRAAARETGREIDGDTAAAERGPRVNSATGGQ